MRVKSLLVTTAFALSVIPMSSALAFDYGDRGKGAGGSHSDNGETVQPGAGSSNEGNGRDGSDGRDGRPSVSADFETLVETDYAGPVPQSFTVVRSQDALDRLYNTMLAGSGVEKPEVDFENGYVLAVFQGQRNTGGYNIKVSNVLDVGPWAMARVVTTSPGSDCAVTQSLTSPAKLVYVPAEDAPSNMSFVHKHHVRPCGDDGSNGGMGGDGSNGDAGDNGGTGDDGANGDTGDNGGMGDDGSTGDTGDNGGTGDDGSTGDNGGMGDDGSTGDTGDNGGMGDDGSTGDTGDNGGMGDDGSTGDTDDNGGMGDDGSTDGTGDDGATDDDDGGFGGGIDIGGDDEDTGDNGDAGGDDNAAGEDSAEDEDEPGIF